MQKVIAIIGDIAMSKKIKEREKFQSDLVEILKKISEDSKEHLHSPYTLTLGDEFQVVYKNPTSILKDIWKILEVLYPHHARFAIGIDLLTTQINPEKSLGMDGPAFYRARDGLNSLKKQSTTIIQFYGSQTQDLALINQYLKLQSSISEKWKLNTIKILNGLFDNHSIETIAQKTGITTRGVYKNIRNNELDKIIDIQNQITISITRSFKDQ